MRRFRRCKQPLQLLVLALGLSLGSQGFSEEISAGKVSIISTEVANEVYSPFCPGKTIAMCTSPRAADVRREIQQMAKDGMEKEEIKEKIITEFGEDFRLVEPPSGDNWGLFAALGGGFVVAGIAVVLMSNRRKDGEEIVESVDVEDELEDEDDYISDLRKEYKD